MTSCSKPVSSFPSTIQTKLSNTFAFFFTQRRLEQFEMTQRLDDNEKTGKSDITELYQKMRREAEAREVELDEMANVIKGDRNHFEEKILRERQAFR